MKYALMIVVFLLLVGFVLPVLFSGGTIGVLVGSAVVAVLIGYAIDVAIKLYRKRQMTK